jgi:hypothetical protein
MKKYFLNCPSTLKKNVMDRCDNGRWTTIRNNFDATRRAHKFSIKTQNYNFTSCFVWIKDAGSHIIGGTKAESF